jgi:hypothetical protein
MFFQEEGKESVLVSYPLQNTQDKQPKRRKELGMVVHTHKPTMQWVEAGGL